MSHDPIDSVTETVKCALAFQAREGRLDRHGEVVQEGCAGFDEDVLSKVGKVALKDPACGGAAGEAGEAPLES